jgi:hypothetical protein
MGWELVSPLLFGNDGLEQIRKVCKILNDNNAEVDKRTGFHVHHDARHLAGKDFARLFAFYCKFEPVINALVAPSRRNNHYCKSISQFFSLDRTAALHSLTSDRAKNDWYSYYNRAFGTRYIALNYEAYSRHGSIEFRQHQGTTDADKICWWVVMTQNMVEIAHSNVRFSTTTDVSFISFRKAMDCYHNDDEASTFSSKYMVKRFHEGVSSKATIS